MKATPRTLGVVGASGHMGTEVLAALSGFPELQLGAAVVAPGSPLTGTSCVGDILFSDSIEAAARECSVIVEFAGPEASVETARVCARYGRPAVLASTGQSVQQKHSISEAGKSAALLLAPNLSLGIFVLRQLVSELKKSAAGEFDVEILDLHHRRKKDSPSGTALQLARTVGGEIVQDRFNRQSSRSPGEVGVASLRGGDVVGEHTVFFIGDGERLEITHRAWSRSIFARGAIKSALELLDKPPGLYELGDLFR